MLQGVQIVHFIFEYFSSTLPADNVDCGQSDCCHCLLRFASVLDHFASNSVGCDSPALDTEPNSNFHGHLAAPLSY